MKIFNVLIFSLAILGLILYWRGALDNLWLDELWSLDHAMKMDRIWDVFFIRHDNNHILNTLYMYIIGRTPHWLIYRIPSIVTGTLTIILIPFCTIGKTSVEKLTAATMTLVSFPLITYSSEARGYAPALFFAIFSYFSVLRYTQTKKYTFIFFYWVSVILGLLSHLTYIFILLSVFLWTASWINKEEGRIYSKIIHFLKVHSVPVIIMCGMYFIFIRYLAIGGGDGGSELIAIKKTLLLAAGVPDYKWLGIVGVSLWFLAVIIGFRRIYEKEPSWAFFFSVLLIMPAYFLLIRPPEYLHPRYLLIAFPFFYLLFSHVLASAWESGIRGKVLHIAVFAGIAIGNIYQLSGFYHFGRGGYKDAIELMANQSSEEIITVGSDHDFRNKIVIEYYRQFLPEGKRLVYFDQGSWPRNGPEWVITHDEFDDASKKITVYGVRYSLIKTFRFSGLSGWYWFVYRNNSGL